MKLVGYARVSTVEQNLDMQIAALKAAGCTETFTDHGLSGADFQRPGLLKALRQIKRVTCSSFGDSTGLDDPLST